MNNENNYIVDRTLDIADSNYTGKLGFGIFQGTKNLTLQLTITKEGEQITTFTPVTITPYLIVYDRLDALSTAYQLQDNLGITINTQAGIKLVVNSGVLSDIVKYPNKCGLVFNMVDGNGVSMITTEFEYYVIPNNAYDFIYGIIN